MEENNMMTNNENTQTEESTGLEEVTYFNPITDDEDDGIDVKSIAIGAGVAAAVTAAVAFGPRAVRFIKMKRLEHARRIVEAADSKYEEYFEDEEDIEEVEVEEVNPQEEAKDENVKEKKGKK